MVVDCGVGGIDFKLKLVLIFVDEFGGDFIVECWGGVIDYWIFELGVYIIKIYDFIFDGGIEYFYCFIVKVIVENVLIECYLVMWVVGFFFWLFLCSFVEVDVDEIIVVDDELLVLV